MLVLSRKVSESIEIDGRIKVTIKKIKGNRVVVGIDAPDDVAIVRSELKNWIEPALANRTCGDSGMKSRRGSGNLEADTFGFAI